MSYIKPAGGLSKADKATAREWMVEGHTLLHGRVQGTIPTRVAATITPGTTDQIIPAGVYLEGAQTIRGDAALVPENIRSGVSIFGVTGTIIPIACCFAAHISWSGGFIHEHVITDCGAGYIASAQSNVYGDGWIYTSCKVLKDFSGYQIIATSSAKAAKYNGIAISTSRDNPTNFVAGSSISFGSTFVEKRDVTDILCIALI